MSKTKERNVLKSLTILSYILLIGGIIGFIYETIFYRIDLGYFVKRGTTIGPWVPIYAFGSAFIIMLTKKIEDKPFLIFILSLIITGVLEYATGYVLFHFFNTRLWDYNTEIWNFGNINGYVCLRSVLLFALGGVFLVKVIKPHVLKLCNHKNGKIHNIIIIILGFIFLIDTIATFFIKFF